jgi:hypothetical protein
VSQDSKENQAGENGKTKSKHPSFNFMAMVTYPSSIARVRRWNNFAHTGVGILFVEEEDPSGFVRVTVKALIEGGSAEKTGQVKSGDMVVRVGNQDVIGKPLSILRTMIPGPIGSYCKLGFLRGGVALNSNAVQVCCILHSVLKAVVKGIRTCRRKVPIMMFSLSGNQQKMRRKNWLLARQ